MILLLLSSFVWAAQVGDVIRNTADISYQIGTVDKNASTNEVNLTIAQTPATIEFLSFDPSSDTEVLQSAVYIDVHGNPQAMPAANMPDGTTLSPPESIGVQGASTYAQEDLVIIRVTDIDQNTDISTHDTIEVNVTNPSTGDVETLILRETTPNSGVFVGYIHTTPALASSGDGLMSVEANNHIFVNYIDNGTVQSIEAEAEIIATQFRLLATKTQSKDTAGVGEHLKYSVTIENIGTILLNDILIEDKLPNGIKYIKDSFKVAGVKQSIEISSDGKTLSYTHPSLAAGASIELGYVVLVTAGVIDAKAVNRAWASSRNGGISNIASVTLKVKEELYRSKGFILGMVYDANISCEADRLNEQSKGLAVASTPIAPVSGEAKQLKGCGVEGVKLYMEDGRFVVTDKQGKYHFVDVANGTHVVQMDTESFKGRYELVQCKMNTRFAGSSSSQFVDMHHGGLKRVDFCLQRKAGVTGKASLELSIAKKSSTEVTLGISVHSDMPLIDPEIFLALSEGLEYVSSSISTGVEPQVSEDMLVIKIAKKKSLTLTLRTLEGADPDKELRAMLYFDTQLAQNQRSEIASVLFTTKSAQNPYIASITKSQDQVSISSVGGNTAIEDGDYNWTKATKQIKMPEYTADEVDELGKKPQIVWPPEGWIPDIPSTRVAILYPKGGSVELKLNGHKVSMLNYEGIFRSSDRAMQIMHYKGVDLREQENTFEAIIKAKGGVVVAKVSRKVFVESRAPKSIEFLPEYSYLVADGKHSPIIAVQFTGPSGHPLRGGMVGSFTTDDKHAPAHMNNGKGQYKIDSEGIAYIKLEPTAISGETVLSFKLIDDEIATVTTRLKPHMRDWILVGYAEGTIGYNTLHGNRESLSAKGAKDKWYHKGRVAFFAKGRIKGKWLLTMAYDSGREEGDRKLFDEIDSDAYYTLYNDASTQGSEAPSTKKLYLKIERDEFSLLFGDYETGLNKTELSSYSRSFTGIKSEYHGTNLDAVAFVAESRDLFFRDELRGDGTSGYYQLSQKPIIEGSESIVIETRDRYRAEIIIESKELKRYRDYDIDYDKGTLYFKEAIYSTDSAFNPRYIVAKYEVDGLDKKHYTYGGRVAIKSSDDKYEAGASYISQENGNGDSKLYGVDATLKIGEYTQIKAEYAQSTNSVDGNETKGEATKLTIEYKKEQYMLNAYYRKQDAAFGLGQLSTVLSATRKIGAEVAVTLSKLWKVDALVYQNRTDTNGTATDENVFQTTVSFTDKLWEATIGYHYADNTNTKATHQMIGKIKRSFLDNNLSIWLSHDQSLGDNEDKEFPTKTALGVDYRYDTKTTIFGIAERIDSSDAVSWQSRMGVIYEPWTHSRMTLTRLYEAGKDKTRIYDTMGLTRSMVFKDKWKATAGYEKGIVWDDNSSTNDNFDAFRLGIGYKGDRFGSDATVEYRHSDIEEKANFDVGLYIQQSDSIGLAFALGYHKKWSDESETRDIDAKMAFVYRPEKSDWIILNRLDFVDAYSQSTDDETQTRKLINNLHINWQANDKWEIGAQYGLKHVTDEIDSQEYNSWTDLLGIDVRYDITEKWSFGLQGSVLHSYTADNFDYGFGAFVDTTIWKNSALTLGYNIEGFDDEDFSQQNYYYEGPYIRFRMKFDQDSMKDLAKGVLGE